MTRVLVVEDEESFSDALSYMLRREGFEAVVAGSGPHAQDVPGVDDRHSLRRERNGHVEHPPALLGVVEDEHGRHDRPVPGLAGTTPFKTMGFEPGTLSVKEIS